MMFGDNVWLFMVAVAVGVALRPAQSVDWTVQTPLDQYVHSDDGHYSWTEIVSYNYGGVTLYVVNMTSQMYQTDAFSTRSLWWHIVGVAIPDVIRYPEAGFLFVDGGGNENFNPPDRDDTAGVALSLVANDTGIISAYIKAVPNQPIYFHNDPSFMRRVEDRIIAWSWRTFMDSPEPSDPTVILRMPMTKAVKRALDTVTAVSKRRAPLTNVNKFVVSGASKRGWSTWSIAATDQRVVGIAPMVFSLLNFDDGNQGGSLMSHYRNMDGAWSFALEPYYNENLTQEFYTPKAQRLFQVEDMYYYKERLTIPILEIVSTGDEFFLADDNHHWWDDIPGKPMLLMMLPNAEHSMAPHYPQIYGTGVSFITKVFEGSPFPEITWDMGETENGGFIIFRTNVTPRDIKAYSAVTLANDTRRDFRLASGSSQSDVQLHPVIWRQNLQIQEIIPGREYRVDAQKVEDEWVGFFVEGTWDGYTGYNDTSYRMVFTSQVNIIPDTYPHDVCFDADSCYGVLV